MAAMAADAALAAPATRNLKRDGWLNSFGFEGIANFRDVAGVDPEDPALQVAGGRLRRGLLYRSSQLQFATPRDLTLLTEALGVRTYLDLRSSEGVLETRDGRVYDHFPPSPVRRPGQAAPSAVGQRRRVNFHLLRGIGLRKLTEAEKAGNEAAEPDSWLQFELRDPATKRVPKATKATPKEMVQKLERQLAINNKAMLLLSGALIAKVLKECTQPGNYPIVFGCMTGKDRTGLISCLILGALGASDETIIADFMLSQAAVKHNGLLAARNMELARAENPKQFEGVDLPTGGPADPRNQVMASVFPGIMRYTLGVIRELGGFEAYLDSIGFDAAERRKLREILVEGDVAQSKL